MYEEFDENAYRKVIEDIKLKEYLKMFLAILVSGIIGMIFATINEKTKLIEMDEIIIVIITTTLGLLKSSMIYTELIRKTEEMKLKLKLALYLDNELFKQEKQNNNFNIK